MNRKFCIIINPKAGKGKTLKKIPILKDYIANINKADFDIFYSEYSGHAIQLAKDNAEKYDVVIAMGGDGTVNEIARGLVDTNGVLGILPEGRGNDFARCIGFNENIKESIDKIIQFHTETIDVGKIDDIYFINGVGVGFDGYVNQRNQARKIINGAFSYYLTLLECLFLWQPLNMNIKIDGFEIPSRSVFLTAIGNGKYCGGGLNLNPDSEINDGELNLCVVDDISKFKVINNLQRLKNGTIDSLEEVKLYIGKQIQISCEKPMPIHYDGELYITQSREVNITIKERAIKIIKS